MSDESLTGWQRFWKRRRYFVDPVLQTSVIWQAVALAVITQAIVICGILLPLVHDLQHPQDPLATVEHAVVLLYFHDSIWWIMLLSILLPVVGALHLSHRIAGPLVRLRRDLRQLADGPLPAPLQPRRRDHLQAEFRLWNTAVASLAARQQRLAAAARQLHDTLAGLKVAGAGTDDLAAAEQGLQVVWQELQAQLPAERRQPLPEPQPAAGAAG